MLEEMLTTPMGDDDLDSDATENIISADNLKTPDEIDTLVVDQNLVRENEICWIWLNENFWKISEWFWNPDIFTTYVGFTSSTTVLS